jgi:hypothetical protein
MHDCHTNFHNIEHRTDKNDRRDVGSVSNNVVELINPTLPRNWAWAHHSDTNDWMDWRSPFRETGSSEANAVSLRHAIAEAKHQLDLTVFADGRRIRFSRQRPFATEIFDRSPMTGILRQLADQLGAASVRSSPEAVTAERGV